MLQKAKVSGLIGSVTIEGFVECRSHAYAIILSITFFLCSYPDPLPTPESHQKNRKSRWPKITAGIGRLRQSDTQAGEPPESHRTRVSPTVLPYCLDPLYNPP